MSSSLDMSGVASDWMGRFSKTARPVINSPVVVSLTITVTVMLIIAAFDIGFKSVILIIFVTMGIIFLHDTAFESTLHADGDVRGGAAVHAAVTAPAPQKRKIQMPDLNL